MYCIAKKAALRKRRRGTASSRSSSTTTTLQQRRRSSSRTAQEESFLFPLPPVESSTAAGRRVRLWAQRTNRENHPKSDRSPAGSSQRRGRKAFRPSTRCSLAALARYLLSWTLAVSLFLLLAFAVASLGFTVVPLCIVSERKRAFVVVVWVLEEARRASLVAATIGEEGHLQAEQGHSISRRG